MFTNSLQMQFYLIPLGILVLTQLFLLTNEEPTNRTNKNENKYKKIGRLNLKKSKPDEAIQLKIELESSDDDDIDTVPLRTNDISESPEPLQDPGISKLNETCSLDSLPRLKNVFGIIDLRIGTYVVSALGMVHVIFYGCTLFMQLSYMLITIWILITIYSVLSGVIFFTLIQIPMLILKIYIWYTLVFVALMIMMMILVGLVLCAKKEHCRLFFIFIGILWYALTVYFILVVNSYRMELMDKLRSGTAAPIPPALVNKTKMLRIRHSGNQEKLNEKESVQNENKEVNQVDNPDENLIGNPIKKLAETPVETKAENPQTHGVTPARRADIPPS